jgi:hypothetical protein
MEELSKTNFGKYSVKITLIESITGGSDYYISHGKLSIINNNPTIPTQITSKQWYHELLFQGWKYEK